MTKPSALGTFFDNVYVADTGNRKLLWDSQGFKFTNSEDADKFLRREYREGWSLV
jgi:hypothetical protein